MGFAVELLQVLLWRSNRNLTRRKIPFVSGDNCADPAFGHGRKMLHRILEVFEAGSEGRRNLCFTDGGHFHQSPQLPQHGQRLVVSFELIQGGSLTAPSRESVMGVRPERLSCQLRAMTRIC